MTKFVIQRSNRIVAPPEVALNPKCDTAFECQRKHPPSDQHNRTCRPYFWAQHGITDVSCSVLQCALQSTIVDCTATATQTSATSASDQVTHLIAVAGFAYLSIRGKWSCCANSGQTGCRMSDVGSGRGDCVAQVRGLLVQQPDLRTQWIPVSGSPSVASRPLLLPGLMHVGGASLQNLIQHHFPHGRECCLQPRVDDDRLVCAAFILLWYCRRLLFRSSIRFAQPRHVMCDRANPNRKPNPRCCSRLLTGRYGWTICRGTTTRGASLGMRSAPTATTRAPPGSGISPHFSLGSWLHLFKMEFWKGLGLVAALALPSSAVHIRG